MHHRLPYRQLLGRDEALREILASIQLPKFIFTNADRKHAAICLELLGIADLFEVHGCTCQAWWTCWSWPKRDARTSSW